MNDYVPTTEEIRLLMQSSNIAFEIPPEGFDRWLAEVKAEAWEEGYGTGWGDGNYSSNDDYNNPYRQVNITLTHNEIQQLNAALDEEEQ